MIRRLLCFLGFHEWGELYRNFEESEHSGSLWFEKRCTRCGRTKRY